MFESLVSRLTSPPVSRRRHTVHASREVCSEPEEEAAAPAQRRSRTAKQLLDKRRKARLSCADLTAATNAEPERSRMDALKAFLPLRQSKSLGRLDGLKEIERLAQYSGWQAAGVRVAAPRVVGPRTRAGSVPARLPRAARCRRACRRARYILSLTHTGDHR
ncbi:uncharacterized protein [Choristoneura fumiferana]|uniref:uncharacterized protein n=1 Tax=Choristoneura fumiferana TaxID=7141 RepID=UPI003D15E07A